MKAIQIRFLAATNFKGARMKAWADRHLSITLPFQYELSCDDERARLMATELMIKLDWDKHSKISWIGALPNGDWCATLEGK